MPLGADSRKKILKDETMNNQQETKITILPQAPLDPFFFNKKKVLRKEREGLEVGEMLWVRSLETTREKSLNTVLL